MPKDPICGMEVNPRRAIKATKGNEEYFFYSNHCKDSFLAQENIDNLSVSQPAIKRNIFR